MIDPQIVASPWTPEMISALFAGIERILIALGGIILALVGLSLQNRAARKGGEAAGEKRDAVITSIAVKQEEVHKLVNGPVVGQLQQIADLLEEKAVRSGDVGDRARADAARTRATQQAEVTQPKPLQIVEPR